MPRYFFNVLDGRSPNDTEGTVLPNWPAARREAVRLAGYILRDEAEQVLVDEEWTMEVTDTSGLVLLRLDFTSAETAATRTPMLENS